MFLDKESKKMLDNLIAGTPDFPRDTYSYDYICDAFAIEEDSMFRIVKGLETKGLVEYAFWSSDESMGITLTQAGIAYKEIQQLETWAKWKERIYGFISGVAVTVLAGFIIKLFAG